MSVPTLRKRLKRRLKSVAAPPNSVSSPRQRRLQLKFPSPRRPFSARLVATCITGILINTHDCLTYRKVIFRFTPAKKNMAKQCAVCGGDGKYKCPTCLVYYCCVGCCQAHSQKGCGVVTDRTGSSEMGRGATAEMAEVKYPTADTVFPEELMKLKDDKTINELLCNPHLRKYLVEVNESSKPEDMMQKAMQEPIFVEFAEQCLRIVKPEDFKNPNLD